MRTSATSLQPPNHSSKSPSPTLTHVGEFVEDVGQAANVQAAVRSFVTTLRPRKGTEPEGR